MKRLVVLKSYLDQQRKEGPGLTFEEFERSVGGGRGSDFRFLEGWLEVCYF
jgi:hypothetical protein